LQQKLNIWQCNKISGHTTDILPPNFKLWQHILLIATIYILLQYFGGKAYFFSRDHGKDFDLNLASIVDTQSILEMVFK